MSRSIAIEIICNALRRVADNGALRVRVNPDDLEMVRSNRADLLHIVEGVSRTSKFVEDRRVGAGGCIVETESGSIDARIETQLASLGDTLNGLKLVAEAA